MRSSGWLGSIVLAALCSGFVFGLAPDRLVLPTAPPSAAAAEPGPAPLAVPTFVAGPLLSGGTLIWQDAAGLEARSPGGRTRSLLPGGTLSDVSAGGGWIALDTGRALLAGPADTTPRRVRLPPACLPLRALEPPISLGNPGAPPRALFAITGARLLAVVGPGCPAGRRDAGAAARLVRLDVKGRFVRLVRRLGGVPRALAADGSSVAVFDWLDDQGAATFTIQRPAGRVAARPGIPLSLITPDLQVDVAGDLLATALTPPLPPVGVEATGLVVPAGRAPFDPGIQATEQFTGQTIPTRAAAALSGGRLAFLTYTPDASGTPGESVPVAPFTEIEVIDAASRRPAATIEIAADNDVLGIALEGADLTWIQQPVADVLGPPTTNPGLPTCEFGAQPTGSPVVEHEDLDRLVAATTTPITIGSSPAPVACTDAPPPP